MLTAILKIGESLVSIKQIGELRGYLEFHNRTAMQPTATVEPTAMFSEIDFSNQTIIFRYFRRVGHDEHEYQFDHVQSSRNFTFKTQTFIVELDDPTEEISIDRLADKMRDNSRIKELLIQYYNN